MSLGEAFQISLDGPMPKCHECGKEWPKFGMYVAAHWHDSFTHTCECGAVYDFQDGEAEQVKHGKTWTKKAKVSQ